MEDSVRKNRKKSDNVIQRRHNQPWGGGRRNETKLSYDTESEYENSRTQRSQHLPKPTTTPRLEGT